MGIRQNYNRIREHIVQSNGAYTPSDYWKIESDSFQYMWNANDEILERLRDHTHWISGVRSYDYKQHHIHNSKSTKFQLDELKKRAPSLSVHGEPGVLGDFGFKFYNQLFNIDTLKFHESILALHLSGNLSRLQNMQRPVICEIGAGWGGFAAMLLVHVPHAQYVVVDLDATLLFSGVYLPECFPNKKFGYFGSKDFVGDEDVIFVSAHQFDSWLPNRIDLAVNLVSFQEMTDSQVRNYSEQLLRKKTLVTYSHNKQKSRNNSEITSVNSHFQNWPAAFKQEVLDWDYSGALENAGLMIALRKKSLLSKAIEGSIIVLRRLPVKAFDRCNRVLKLILKPALFNYVMSRVSRGHKPDRYTHYFFYSNQEITNMGVHANDEH
jgi:putative sugar O-methyltransferase